MKKFIYKTNQFLLERFPTIWNTKIVWMLCIALIIHILFYLFGFYALSNIELLKERRASDIFFENGTVFFSIIISIIMLVVWLSLLFKNNAFKNLYPTKRLQLFSQFFQYFIIILVSSTFYFSYMFGLQNYINYKYDDSQFEKDVEIANNASVFLSHKLSDYTINERYYPKPFDSIFCEANEGLINTTENYYVFKDKYYQFYTLKTKVRPKNISYESSEYDGFVHTKHTDSTTIFYFKDKVLTTQDLLINYTQTAVDTLLISHPTYYNYSDNFFKISAPKEKYYYSYTPFDNDDKFSSYKIQKNKAYYELLQRGNRSEIATILKDFLTLSDRYKIKRNIDLNQWQQLVFKEDGFKISGLINDEKPHRFDIPSTREKTEYQKFIAQISTDYYINTRNLNYIFENINNIKNEKILNESIHVFYWIAFLFAGLIFLFRITSIRVFIFTLVTSALLMVLSGLILVLIDYIGTGYKNFEYIALSYAIILGTLIILIPLLLINKIRKSISGIFMNITTICFPLYILTIVFLISLYQRENCLNTLYATQNYKIEDCFVLISYLEFRLSYLLLCIGFVFIYFYSGFVKKWRALPEK